MERKQITLEDWLAKGEQLFGKDRKTWRFVCPQCKTVQCEQDLLDAGVDEEESQKYLAFSCIGRFNDKKTGCDWTLGGLFSIHTLEVTFKGDDKVRPVFEFDEGQAEEKSDDISERSVLPGKD